MNGKVLENYDSVFNDFVYFKDEIVEVTELEKYTDEYVIYRGNTLDWIPKRLIQILK